MILITIVTGVYKLYKPIYNWGAPHCRNPDPFLKDPLGFKGPDVVQRPLEILCVIGEGRLGKMERINHRSP